MIFDELFAEKKMAEPVRGPWSVDLLISAKSFLEYGNTKPDLLICSYNSALTVFNQALFTLHLGMPLSAEIPFWIAGMRVQYDPCLPFGEFHIISSSAIERTDLHRVVIMERQ